MKYTSCSFSKILLCTILLYVLVSNRGALVSVALDPVVRVEPYSTLAQVGEMFTVNVTLADVQNLYGIEIVLSWNASVIKIVDIDVRLGVESYPDGVLHEPIFLVKNETLQEQGQYTLAAASTAPASSFNGSGNIVQITFNVTNDGSSELNLETKLADKPPPGGAASPITHKTIGGFFGRVIKVFLSRTVIVVGEEVNISGFIIPARADVEVTIAYRHYGETDWRSLSPTIRTDDQGNYRFAWQPQDAGKYEIKTNAVIEGKEEESASVFLIVEAPEQNSAWQYGAIAMAVGVIIVVAAMVIIYQKKSKRKLL